MQQQNRQAMMQMFEMDGPGSSLEQMPRTLPGDGSSMLPGGMQPPAGAGMVDTFDPAQRSSNTGVGGPTAPIDAAPKPSFSMPTELHGRAAVYSDPNDLLHIASQQQGFDISNNDAVRRTYESIIKPLFAQQGMDAGLVEHDRLDKLNVGGRVFDFVGGAGGANPTFWVGEEGVGGGAPAGPAPSPGGGGLNMGALDPQLQGDPMAAIQAALARYAGGPNYLQSLLGKFGG
jgi:hypothetical protein